MDPRYVTQFTLMYFVMYKQNIYKVLARLFFLFFLSIALQFNSISGQARIIPIKNPSFEGNPTQGGSQGRFSLKGWVDCGFKDETPPDIQGAEQTFFDVQQKPFDGHTYLGMVVRATNTWERISQHLKVPLLAGQCYKFSIYLSRANEYISGLQQRKIYKVRDVKVLKKVRKTDSGQAEYDFTNPVVLRIWAGNGYCNQKELLAESQPVINNNWMRYDFYFKPKFTHDYFELEAYYEIPVSAPYNGNVLLDKASNIIPIFCPPEEKLYTSTVSNPEYNRAQQKHQIAKTKPKKTPGKRKPVKKAKPPVVVAPPKTKENKIIKELDSKKIHQGQVIKIEKLYFDADSTSFTEESKAALDEIYDFLVANPNVHIEIGGHTNNRPKPAYCNWLSTQRAKSVYDYLVDKGIALDRLSYKGYGKRKPVAPNSTIAGRKKNQRVEIKIMKI